VTISRHKVGLYNNAALHGPHQINDTWIRPNPQILHATLNSKLKSLSVKLHANLLADIICKNQVNISKNKHTSVS